MIIPVGGGPGKGSLEKLFWRNFLRGGYPPLPPLPKIIDIFWKFVFFSLLSNDLQVEKQILHDMGNLAFASCIDSDQFFGEARLVRLVSLIKLG